MRPEPEAFLGSGARAYNYEFAEVEARGGEVLSLDGSSQFLLDPWSE